MTAHDEEGTAAHFCGHLLAYFPLHCEAELQPLTQVIAFKMMNSALKMVHSALKMVHSALKMVHSALKMVHSALKMVHIAHRNGQRSQFSSHSS